MNNSPWITELNNDRLDYLMFKGNDCVDISIVGAGIAGISTAYFLLKETNAIVGLIDAGRIAHGATGHNAGQIAPYFEKGFDEILEQYGEKMAHDAQQAMFDARDKLIEMIDYSQIDVSVNTFIGYAGCSTHEQLLHHLRRKRAREITHNDFDAIFIEQNYSRIKELDEEFCGLYEVLPQAKIRDLLQTKSTGFIGVLACKKAVTNSALLCQELVKRMLLKYSGRLYVQENSPVTSIEINEHNLSLHYSQTKLNAKKVVLCTNGFKNCIIKDLRLQQDQFMIYNKLMGSTYSIVGYMSAYTDPKPYGPIAISYFMNNKELESSDDEDAYFYFTRRSLQNPKDNSIYTLVSLGGPEQLRTHEVEYSMHLKHPERAHKKIHDFFVNTYRYVIKSPRYSYRWHGLMGFTSTGLRIIGEELICNNLLYNIGCNGVGILSSVHGGRKISQIYQKKLLSPSVFDPIF